MQETKKNKNIPLVIAVIILGSLAFWFIINNKKGTIRESLKNFAVEDTTSITKIFLADKEGRQVTLEKIKPGEWKVNQKYFARNEAINLLLFTMKNIKVKEPVGIKARDNALKQMSVIATRMEAYSGEKLEKVYYIGSETQNHTGTYMLMVNEKTGENSDYPFITFLPGMEGYLTTRYFTTLNEWRDRTIFRYQPDDIKSLEVIYPSKPSESFLIIQNNPNDFELKSPQENKPLPFNIIAVKQYLSYFQNIQFESVIDVMPKATKDSIIATVPMTIYTIKDKNGKVNKVKCFSKVPEREQLDVTGKVAKYDLDHFYGLINNGEDLVLCQYFNFGKLFQSPAYFITSPKVVKK
jgi:hypothetical protein